MTGWTGPVFPSLPGIAFPVSRKQNWSTVKQEALSGKRTRYPLYTYPTYSYQVSFDFLRSDSINLELQSLMGFIAELQGPYALFGYTDTYDNSVAVQSFGAGDGATTAFQLVRTFGGFTEPVFLLNGAPSIFVNGVLKTITTDYTVSAYGVITFTTPPAAAAPVTWTGSYYWPCRFDDDTIDFSNFMLNLYDLKKLSFTTEKLP